MRTDKTPLKSSNGPVLIWTAVGAIASVVAIAVAICIAVAAGRIQQNIKDTNHAIAANTGAIKDTNDAIAVNTGAIKDTNDAIAANTESIEQSLFTIAGRGSSSGQTDLPIDIPEPDPTPDDPRPVPMLKIVGGEYGPISEDEVRSGVPCHPDSINCRFLQYEMSEFSPGIYELTCEHDGWGQFENSSFGRVNVVTIDQDSTFPKQATCFINFDRLTGTNGVRIVARGPITSGADGSVNYGQRVESNWTKETIDLPLR